MFVQANNQKPKELKTTAKFLQHLSDLSVAVTVFKNNKNYYATFGGYLEYIVTRYYGVDDVAFPGFGSQSQEIENKMVFFDSTFDSNFDFVNAKQQEPMAIDNIYYYLSTNKNAALQNIVKLKDFSILSYYDTSLKQFVIRKFTDGFIRLDDGNPIINKSVFSKPASFEPIKTR